MCGGGIRTNVQILDQNSLVLVLVLVLLSLLLAWTKDRQKVITQIIQNMCRRPSLNQVAFELPTIYLPSENDVSV